MTVEMLQNSLIQQEDTITFSGKIQEFWSNYFEKIVPEMAKAKNNDECGSIAVCDILCLQALSKRIHYGKFVAEAKFQEAPSKYEAAIKAKDRKLLLELLTDKTVEAIAFGQVVQIDEAYNVTNPTYKIKPSFIANLFEEWVMPLTKEVQVEYLLRRLD
ncbi:chorismate mutase 3, chloroplastic-like [Vigna umbellata]|uniref:chorismate mutase 3, chloroplastic-like n=1 Tax=Vigna umbellata TaxID=87088 RepID=UPI001F5EA07D|nr:chorismate mutase 3, chloroplastic-like [Vigna umbellata]